MRFSIIIAATLAGTALADDVDDAISFLDTAETQSVDLVLADWSIIAATDDNLEVNARLMEFWETIIEPARHAGFAAGDPIPSSAMPCGALAYSAARSLFNGDVSLEEYQSRYQVGAGWVTEQDQLLAEAQREAVNELPSESLYRELIARTISDQWWRLVSFNELADFGPQNPDIFQYLHMTVSYRVMRPTDQMGGIWTHLLKNTDGQIIQMLLRRHQKLLG